MASNMSTPAPTKPAAGDMFKEGLRGSPAAGIGGSGVRLSSLAIEIIHIPLFLRTYPFLFLCCRNRHIWNESSPLVTMREMGLKRLEAVCSLSFLYKEIKIVKF